MFEHKKPGERWTPKAFELNAILDAGRKYQSAAAIAASRSGPGLRLQPGVIRVKNTTGSDADRYTAWAIGDSRWTLDGNSNLATSVFALNAYTSGDAVAILQTPLKTNEIGYATVFGPTLGKVTGGGTTANGQATPNSSGALVPDDDGPVRLLQERPTGGGYVLCNLPCDCTATPTDCNDYGETWYLKFCTYTTTGTTCAALTQLAGTEISFSLSAPSTNTFVDIPLTTTTCAGVSGINNAEVRLFASEPIPATTRAFVVIIRFEGGLFTPQVSGGVGDGATCGGIFDTEFWITDNGGAPGAAYGISAIVSKTSSITCGSPPPVFP